MSVLDRSSGGSTTEAPGLRAVLAAGALRAVYQPIVDLATGRPVAYEALARGPVGTPLERPDALFAAARAGGLLAALDDACRAAALRGARRAGLAQPWTLFVNTEPEAVAGTRFGAEPDWAGRPRIVVEFTERALVRDPAGLLRTVARVRELGYGVALDDVGAEPASLALLPLLRPDVVKLDLRLVQDRPSADIAAIVTAVNAEAERTGAVVLAEGVETPAHLQAALALGATLGQGWLFGRPEPLPDAAAVAAPAEPILPAASPSLPGSRVRSPFTLAASARPVRRADKRLLVEISKHLERQAAAAGECTLVVSTFQHAHQFTPGTARRYERLAAGAVFVGALGAGLPPSPVAGVRGGHLDRDDPLLDEWDVAVLSPHFAAALVARDLGDPGGGAGEDARRFDSVITYDRALAVEVAACLMTRVAAG
jgi:EAL domain-containing protein (putative c-di-GMP-specific phosphodiesterase class I)